MRTRLCPRPAPRRRSETRPRSKARAAGRRQSGSLRRPAPSGKRRSRCARRSAAHASRTSARALFCHRPRSPCGPCAGKGPGPGGRLQGSCRNCTQTPNQGLCGEMTPARARKRARPFHALMPFIGSLTKSGCAARGSSSGRSGLFLFYVDFCHLFSSFLSANPISSLSFVFFCLLLHSFFIFSPLFHPFFDCSPTAHAPSPCPAAPTAASTALRALSKPPSPAAAAAPAPPPS